MKTGIFVTGTDTGVGKTFTAVGLIRALKTMGYTVCPMKPVETGCLVRKGMLVPRDTVQIIRASGIHEPLDRVNPYRLRLPLAPSVAAEREGMIIKKQKILSACHELSKHYEIIVVEGAGGIMVPVYKTYLFVDLVRDLGLPLIIVARPGLGTINHTLLTIETARSRGIKVLGVILNATVKKRKGLAEKTNPALLARLGKVPFLGTIPYTEKQDGFPLKQIFLSTAKNIMANLG